MILLDLGLTRGSSSRCLFYNKRLRVCTFAHGDDYVSAGPRRGLEILKKGLCDKYDTKTEVLGDGGDEVKMASVLNRIIEWKSGEGITYRADPRHAQMLSRDLL